MANTLRFKRGLVSGIPTAALGEPLFTTDTFDLYIGNGTTNTRFQKYIASGATTQILRGDGSLYTFPLAISSPSNGQVLKYDGTNWVNSADAGVTGSGTAGQVTYWGSSSTITGSNNLFWDATNNRLGIGTNAPAQALHVSGTARIGNTLATNGATTIEQIYVGDQVLGVVSARYGSGALLLGYGAKAKNGADGYVSSFDNFSARRSVLDINQGYFDFLNTASVNTARGSDLTTSLLMRLSTGGNLILNSASDNGLKFQVTGDGYFSGGLGVGGTTYAYEGISLRRNLTGLTVAFGVVSSGTIQSDVTSGAYYFTTGAKTQAAAFTLGNLYHYDATQGTFGASSAVTNQYGFFAGSSIIGATNNYGFYGNIASGTGRWNLYMNGTAANYLAGSLWIGTTSGNHPLEVASAANTILYIRAGATSLSRLVFGTSTNADRGFIDYDNTAASRNMSFKIAETERMRLDANGRLGIGTTSPAATLTVYSTINDAPSGTNKGGFQIAFSTTNGLSFGTYSLSPFANYIQSISATQGNAGVYPLSLNPNGGSVLIGNTTSTGEALQVTGTMRVSGASTFSTSISSPLINLTATGSGVTNIGLPTGWIGTNNGGTIVTNISSTSLYIRSTSGNAIGFAAGGTTAQFILDSTGAATFSGSVTAGGTITIARGQDANVTNVNINSGVTPVSAFQINTDQPNLRSILMARNGYSLVLGTQDANRVTIDTTGAATFSSTVTGASFIPTSSTIPTNGMYLSAANTLAFATASGNKLTISSTGLATFSDSARFSNLKGCIFVQTGGSLLGSISMDSSNQVTIDNNGFFGLSVGSNYTMTGGNLGIGHAQFGTSATRTISVVNGTAPSTSPTDAFQMYSNDVVAGNAAPHFRTENGAVIKLYQETTAVGNAIISLGGGNSVLDDSTFDGYTLRQIVRALRNQGILQ